MPTGVGVVRDLGITLGCLVSPSGEDNAPSSGLETFEGVLILAFTPKLPSPLLGRRGTPSFCRQDNRASKRPNHWLVTSQQEEQKSRHENQPGISSFGNSRPSLFCSPVPPKGCAFCTHPPGWGTVKARDAIYRDTEGHGRRGRWGELWP